MLGIIEFNVNKFDEDCYINTISYWESRGFTFKQKKQNYLLGYRGNMFGNLFSFNMQKIITVIKIYITNENYIKVEMKINTKFLKISENNKRFWDLELETYKSKLINNDHKELDWVEIDKNTRKEKKAFIAQILYIIFSTITCWILYFLFK